MSVEAVAAAMHVKVKNTMERAVLMGLANVHNYEKNKCFPKISTLAEGAVTSERTVQRTLKKLEKDGLIEVIPKPGTTNRYKFLFPIEIRKKKAATVTPDNMPPLTPEAQTPDKSDPTPDTAVSPTPDTAVSPKQEVTGSKEQEVNNSASGESPVAVLESSPEEKPPPKPPQANAVKSVWLSWAFYVGRLKLGDKYYDPYQPKHLGICKRIIEKKARGNPEVVATRLMKLYEKSQEDNYYEFIPGKLESEWERLADLPRNSNRLTLKAMASHKFWEGTEERQEELKKKVALEAEQSVQAEGNP